MKLYTITQAKIDGTPEADRPWLLPGVTGPGEYAWNERDHTYVPATSGRPASVPQDFDRGFGIGGINRYQPTAAEEMALIEAQMRYDERERKRKRSGPLSHGQLWEPCPTCRREPVCVDCGLCERHCDC